MVKLSAKTSFAGLPPTTRATAFVLGPDPKGKNFLYCTNNSVVIRDIEKPINHDSYYAHQKPPTCAKYSYTGFYICSGDSVGNVKIWDTTQAEHITKYEYQPISGAIKDIAWDGDSKRIAVCGQGREKYAHAFLWDSGSSVGQLGSIEKAGNSVDIKRTRPYRCAVASEDFKTYFYQGPPFKLDKTISEATRFANCVRFSPNGKYFATCNSDGRILLCDGKTGEFIGDMGDPKAHNGGVYSLCFNSDGSELLSASADKSCKIWDVETRQMLVEFVLGSKIEDQQLSCLWQGDYLLSVSFSGDINYLDRNNPSKPSRVITGHNKSISCVSAKRNEAIFTSSFEGNIVRWNPATGEGIRFTGKGHGSMITGMTYIPDTNMLLTVGLDNKLRMTDCDTCEFAPDQVVALDYEPSAVSVTNDGFIVVACEKEIVLIKDCKKLSSLPWKHQHPVKMSAQGGRIVTSGSKLATNKDGEICHVYEICGNNIVDTGTTFQVNKSVTGIAFSHDGARVAVCDSKVVLVFELANGFQDPTKLIGHSNPCKSLAWSPDNQHLASASIDSALYVWDTQSKFSNNVISAHPKSVIRGISWVDENTVVSAAEDCTVKQWTVSF